MNKRKLWILIIIVVVAIGLFVLISYLISVNNYKKRVSSLSYSDIDVSSLHDGVYTGECDVDFIYAKVEVEILNGEIVNINLLEHKHDRGKAAEVIIDRIIDKQSVDVDVISSATNSSKVIKKAIENALLLDN